MFESVRIVVYKIFLGRVFVRGGGMEDILELPNLVKVVHRVSARAPVIGIATEQLRHFAHERVFPAHDGQSSAHGARPQEGKVAGGQIVLIGNLHWYPQLDGQRMKRLVLAKVQVTATIRGQGKETARTRPSTPKQGRQKVGSLHAHVAAVRNPVLVVFVPPVLFTVSHQQKRAFTAFGDMLGLMVYAGVQDL